MAASHRFLSANAPACGPSLGRAPVFERLVAAHAGGADRPWAAPAHAGLRPRSLGALALEARQFVLRDELGHGGLAVHLLLAGVALSENDRVDVTAAITVVPSSGLLSLTHGQRGAAYGSVMWSRLDDLFAAAAARICRYTPADAHVSEAAIVDIRSQDAREHDGAIPGAYHVPPTVLEWRLASDEWRNTELDGRTVILVCDQGYSSVLAASVLVELGRDGGDIEGGYEAWRSAGLPVTTVRAWDGLAGMGPPD